MNSNIESTETKKTFDPLQIMGIFWLAFGVIVLASSFFIKATEQVPLMRGVITNVIAGILLLGAGIFSIVKAKINQKKAANQ